MSAYARALLIVAAILASATLLNAVVIQRVELAIVLGLVTIGLLGFGVGVGVRPRAPAPEPAVDGLVGTSTPTPPDSHDVSPTRDRPADDPPLADDALVQFAQELVAATSMSRFRRAIAAHLPLLLGTRRVWIAGRTPQGRQVIVPADGDLNQPEALLDVDGREWTTFALRVGNETVGVLGVESSGGLHPRIRRVVQLVAPMIAQAMATAQTVDSLRAKSVVDLMTGLATRQEGMARLESEFKRAHRAGTSMAVLMLDLDQFKSVNDRFGHPAGDAMLAAVGRTIMRSLRASDIRARWGGEEFLIALPETDLPRAQVVANGLLREIAAATIPTPAGPVGSTVSIGITISRPGETDTAAMIRRADMALYHAKSAGRACVRVVLGDRSGNPVAISAPAPAERHATALPFPDRRNPHRPDRRRVPSPGRRASDPPTAGTTARSVEEHVRRENPQHTTSRR
jgi:diguanylate cyclase (GGDEF)-like protein